MRRQRFTMSLVAGALMLSPSIVFAEESASGGIGVYTAVMGKVSVTHSGEARVFPVKLHDEVLFKDVIQTDKESRTKAFFQDDSVLTVGENSRVEITEYIYNPEANVRRSVVRVVQGQVRALVSKVFKSNGSRFEVHTPSAVAAARGTYFSVWHENGQSGIINIGESGRVDFTSGGVTVAVDPGQFSMAEHGMAPSIPAIHGLGVNTSTQSEPAHVAKRDTHGVKLVDRHEGKRETSHQDATINEPSSRRGLARAILSVENTMLREALSDELPTQALHPEDHARHLANAHATLMGLSEFHGKTNHDSAKSDKNTYGLSSTSSGNTVSAAMPVVASPPAVFTDAGEGAEKGNSGSSGSGSGSNSGHGHNGYKD
ncbi:MAG: hypothetical protein HOP22_06275 [Nitrospiraceae bacterium]|nr:hypothetical protein [Nitrospiraceae bacterium]